MLVFVCVYFLPVYLGDTFLAIRSAGWQWWPSLLQGAMEGRKLARDIIEQLIILAVWIIALLVPIKAFFGEKSLLPSRDQ